MNNLLQEIKKTGLINYAQLRKKESLEAFPEALSQLLKEAEAEFEALLSMPDEALNYQSFMDPFLTSAEDLLNLFKAIDSFNSSHSSDATRKIIADFQPALVDFQNKISFNAALYRKLKLIQKTDLNPHEKRSLELVIRDMEVAGVHLHEEGREQLKQINKKLSELSEKFSNHVIDAKAEFFYEMDDNESLKEMPEEDKEAARKEAKNRKSEKEFVFTLSPPSTIAILRYCADQSIREKLYKANNQVAVRGKHDNRPVALEILKLRQEKAKLLGFKNYAQYVLQERMAPSTEKVLETLKAVAEKAGAAAQDNIRELREFVGKDDLKEWDLSYYSEKLKKAKYDVDSKTLKPYFSFEKVLEGLFEMIKTLFDIDMKPIEIEPYAEGSKAFEVHRKGDLIAYYFIDPYTRPEKRPGAWANDLRSGYLTSKAEKRLPIVINECNFPQPGKDKPSLLSHRDVETIFHEFGHAIHVMLSSHNLPNLNGFHTEWDFVEAPSQILENWCWEYDVLKTFAKHYETDEVIPKEVIDKLKKTKNFMAGLFLIRQNEFGYLDYSLHSQPIPETVEALDKKCFEVSDQYSVLKKFEGYSMYTNFSHVFAGGYSAGYYSYVWAEILEADMFEEAKKIGLLNPAFGEKYADEILSPGTQKPAMELFTTFTGRQPNIEALFKKHGIDVN